MVLVRKLTQESVGSFNLLITLLQSHTLANTPRGIFRILDPIIPWWWYIYIYIYIYSKSKVKLATVVEGNPKALFSIATTPRCRGRAVLLSQDCSTLSSIRTLYCWVLNKEVSSTIFKVFGMMWPGIELRSPGPLANTLTTWSMSIYICIYICICSLPGVWALWRRN